MGDAMTVNVLARLEAMAALLDGQAADIEALRTENAALRAQVARLEAPAATAGAAGPATKPRLKRRGMLRRVLGATAAAALLTAAKRAATAEAAVRGTILGGSGTTTQYGLVATNFSDDPVFYLPDLGSYPFGVIGVLSNPGIPAPFGAGVLGSASSNSGVLGLSSSNFGVFGQSGSYFGVGGSARHAGGGGTGTGVLGMTNTGIGVEGWATNGGTGIRGSANYGAGPDFSGNGIGVEGRSGSGIGVQGTSTDGIGVYGQSTNSYGCGGATSKPGFAGLFGYAGVASAAGFLGVNGAPGGTAGYFHGAVTVDGPFQVVNGPKNALVAHPDGSHRRMYCQESPEPWFEDFGRGQLQGGKATVRLDPDFAAVSRNDDYSVFPVPEGECKGLYVAARTPTSFDVRELQGGTSSVPFSYRLVAGRKDDVGKRLEKVDLPKFDLHPPAPPATPPGQDKRPPR